MVAILLAACGGPDPRQAIETIDSWSAAAALARADLAAHRVTPRYARQVLDRAREGRADAAKTLGASSPDARQRASGDRALASLDAGLAGLAAALGGP